MALIVRMTLVVRMALIVSHGIDWRHDIGCPYGLDFLSFCLSDHKSTAMTPAWQRIVATRFPIEQVSLQLFHGVTLKPHFPAPAHF